MTSKITNFSKGPPDLTLNSKQMSTQVDNFGTNESFQALMNQSVNLDKSIEFTIYTEEDVEDPKKKTHNVPQKSVFSSYSSNPSTNFSYETKGIKREFDGGKKKNNDLKEENEEETEPISPPKPRKRTVSFGTSVEVFNLDEEPSRINIYNPRPEGAILKVAIKESSFEGSNERAPYTLNKYMGKKRNLYRNTIDITNPLPDIQDYENEEDINENSKNSNESSSEERDQSSNEGEPYQNNPSNNEQNNDIRVQIGPENRNDQLNADTNAINTEEQTQRLNQLLRKLAKFKFRRTIALCLVIIIASFILGFLLEENLSWQRRTLFCIVYAFLSYYLIENIIQISSKQILSWKRWEDIFHTIDVLNLIIFAVLVDLNLSGIKVMVKFGCVVPILGAMVYFCKSSAPRALKESKTLLRVLFGLELFFIGARIDEDIDWPWRTITSLVWLYLALVCLYCFLMLVTLVCVVGLSLFKLTMYEHVPVKVQIAGFLWSSLYSGFGAIGFVSLAGISYAYDSEEEDKTLLKNSILAWRCLSIFLMIFTLVAYRWVLDFLVNFNFEEAYYREELGLIKDEDLPQVITEKKDVYLVMLSSTYFLPLKKSFLVRNEKLRKLRRNLKKAKDKRYKPKAQKGLDLPLQQIRKGPVNIETLKKDKENLDEVFGKVANRIQLIQPSQEQPDDHNDQAPSRLRGMSMGTLNTMTAKRKGSTMSNGQSSPAKVCLSEGDGASPFGSPVLSYKKDEGDLLCYICYERPPNAVIGECGHGGICLECAVETIKAKGKCMECRLEVEKVIKIDPGLKLKNIIKGYETITIIPGKQTEESP